MKRLGVVALLAVGVLLVCGASALASGPFPVWPSQEEPNWQSWGYEVDNQPWANWLVATIPWDTPANMSGTYTLEEDFLFQVDPDTSGLADPSSVYGANWWNHRDASGNQVYGLGEFFDAGADLVSPVKDRQYALTLSLGGGTDTWAVFYDADRDQVNDGGSEHDILAGTVSSYFNRGGNFYGILVDDDGKYDGFFSSSHDEGTPDLVNDTFHVGIGDPIPEPASVIVWGLLGGLAFLGAWRVRRRVNA